MLKRIFSCALALALVFSLTACGKSSGSSKVTQTLSSAEQEALNQAAAGLEDKELQNKVVKWFAHYDITPDGSVPSPAVYLFETKYGGTFEWIQTTWGTRYTDLANLVLAGNSPDFMTAGDMDAFPRGAIQTSFQPIDDYFDLTKPMWQDVKNIWDEFMWDNKHYVATIDIGIHSVFVYNKTVMEDNGYEDPAELFYKGEWTWDKLKEMASDFYDADQGHYAMDGWGFSEAIINSAGVSTLDIANGKIVHNLNNPQFEKAQLFMEELAKVNAAYPRHLFGWDTRPTSIADGTCLLFERGLWMIDKSYEANWGPIDEVMFVPCPKDPDLDYHPIITNVNGYCLIKDAPNPEGFVTYMECLKYANSTDEVKEVARQQDIEKGWNEEKFAMKEAMLEMARQHPVFNIQTAVTTEIENICNEIIGNILIPGSAGSVTWAEVKATYEETLQFYLDEINGDI